MTEHSVHGMVLYVMDRQADAEFMCTVLGGSERNCFAINIKGVEYCYELQLDLFYVK